MTFTNPRTRTIVGRASFAGLAVLFALSTGCKSKDGGSTGSVEKARDPLVYGPTRIPPQNLAVPDRGSIGSNGKVVDPLIGNPTGRNGARVGYSDGPERFKGTYIPSLNSTPAALSGKGKDEELKIDTPDNRVPLKQAGGVLPASPPGDRGDALETLYADLEKNGVKRGDTSLGKEDGKYVFRAAVPIGANGAKRQYTEVGDTANEAVKRALDQVMADGK